MEKDLIVASIKDVLKKYSYKASDECVEEMARQIMAVTFVSAYDELDSWDSCEEPY